MEYKLINLVEKFATFGVLHRNQIKNDLVTLRRLIKRGYVEKVYKKRQVFYQLTKLALPLLDYVRQTQLSRAQLMASLHPRSLFYRALIEDIRFLDESRPMAQDWMFLGDWRLTKPPNRYQLTLAQLRYYDQNI